jgi:hypothetical protein
VIFYNIAPVKYPMGVIDSSHKYFSWPSLSSSHQKMLLLGIFRRASCPSATRGALVPFYFPGGALPPKKTTTFLLVIYDTSSIREPPRVS